MAARISSICTPGLACDVPFLGDPRLPTAADVGHLPVKAVVCTVLSGNTNPPVNG